MDQQQTDFEIFENHLSVSNDRINIHWSSWKQNRPYLLLTHVEHVDQEQQQEEGSISVVKYGDEYDYIVLFDPDYPMINGGYKKIFIQSRCTGSWFLTVGNFSSQRTTDTNNLLFAWHEVGYYFEGMAPTNTKLARKERLVVKSKQETSCRFDLT